MAMKIISMAALVVVVFASSVLQSTYATTYTVGDATGWTIPNNTEFYDNWTDNKNFVVGDVLEFNFPTGRHDVAEVNETAYDTCISTNPIVRYTTGPANITLNRTGEYHFICTFDGHCGIGQKLSIDVRTGPSTAPTPGSTPNPSSPASSLVATISLVFMSIALALFC
ncbi:umecyanin-like [Gossypium australe]|uniref:Umecyanin-like n=1 Tax=Gossypium australe TaxID=47621 RepID=A0A5B6XBI3_9ROSI|nr:umecyanin-like [Gossypium australe]